MNIDEKLDELMNLLDNHPDIKKIQEIKSMITNDEIQLINNYRDNPTIENKKKLYENKIINDYLVCENNINYLIMHINSKFKRKHSCKDDF